MFIYTFFMKLASANIQLSIPQHLAAFILFPLFLFSFSSSSFFSLLNKGSTLRTCEHLIYALLIVWVYLV